MIILFVIGSALFGLAIGSFLNVVALRYGTGLSIVHGRSQCPVCGTHLGSSELIPLFSYLIQRGKCKHCGVKISTQYPIVEVITAGLFALVAIRQYNVYPLYQSLSLGLAHSIFFTVFYWAIVSILVVIAVYDFRHKIIPQGFVYSFIALSILKLVFFFFCVRVNPVQYPLILDVLSPFMLFSPIAFLWFVSQGRWIGFGDAKLAFGMGALLGFISGLSAFVLAFWIGASVAIVLMIIGKFFPGVFGNLRGNSEIPFAPFLILGTLIAIFWHPDVIGISAYFL